MRSLVLASRSPPRLRNPATPSTTAAPRCGSASTQPTHGQQAVGLRHSYPGEAKRPLGSISMSFEQRDAVHHDLDPATDAGRDPDQGAGRAKIGRGTVVVRPPGPAFGRADRQEVLHDHPSRGGLPGGFQHHRPRDVPAMLRHLGIAGAEPEGASAPVQQRPEHARGVRAWQAQPLDGAVWRNQAALLAVGQEPILGNGRKRARLSPRPLVLKTPGSLICWDNSTVTANVRPVATPPGQAPMQPDPHHEDPATAGGD